MKNISRRVFIKGMAVAAVATAASTVLAGCNVPGTDEGTPAVGFSPITKSLTDKNGTIDVTVTGYAFNANGSVTVDLTLVNKIKKGNTYTLVPTASTAFSSMDNDKLYVAANLDGQYSKPGSVTIDSTKGNTLSANSDSEDYILETSVTIANVTDVKSVDLFFAANVKNDKDVLVAKEIVFDLAL